MIEHFKDRDIAIPINMLINECGDIVFLKAGKLTEKSKQEFLEKADKFRGYPCSVEKKYIENTAPFDPLSCAESDLVCQQAKACQSKDCCPKGHAFCDGRCRDVQIDREHCGGCWQSCLPNYGCSKGLCNCTSEGTGLCGADCINFKRDNRHCGSCNRRCGKDKKCRNGECIKKIVKEDPEEDPEDVNNEQNEPVKEDGDCGEKCTNTQECKNSECICKTGFNKCGDDCVSFNLRPNCGGCGKICDKPFHKCVKGECLYQESQWISRCGDDCIFTKSNNEHCGKCGNKCPEGKLCKEGKCVDK